MIVSLELSYSVSQVSVEMNSVTKNLKQKIISNARYKLLYLSDTTISLEANLLLFFFFFFTNLTSKGQNT